MRFTLLGVVVVMASLAVIQGQSEMASGKPVKQSNVIAEAIPPPGTLTGMVAQAEAVVIARATGKARLRPGSRPDSLLTSVHSFDVEEVIKFSASVPVAGEVLELELSGGTKEYDSYIHSEVVEDRHQILPKHRYLLFVGRLGERLFPQWVGAVFDITGNSPQSLDKLFRRYNAKPSAEFLGDVR